MGKGTTEPRQYTPSIIEHLEQQVIIDIVTGDGHCLALTQSMPHIVYMYISNLYIYNVYVYTYIVQYSFDRVVNRYKTMYSVICCRRYSVCMGDE